MGDGRPSRAIQRHCISHSDWKNNFLWRGRMHYFSCFLVFVWPQSLKMNLWCVKIEVHIQCNHKYLDQYCKVWILTSEKRVFLINLCVIRVWYLHTRIHVVLVELIQNNLCACVASAYPYHYICCLLSWQNNCFCKAHQTREKYKKKT
jgi:hypothetical protein